MLKILFGNLDELRQDWRRRFAKHVGQTLWWRIRYYYGTPQYRTLFYYRLWSASRLRLGRSLFHFLYQRSSSRTGIEFHTPRLGGGVIMPHWGRIILNADSIGQNLYVFHNVTVGHDYRRGKPTIGSNVFIGTGSTVIGKIVVGDNVVIGAGSLVTDDIPSNSLVAGNPSKIIRAIDTAYIDAMIGY